MYIFGKNIFGMQASIIKIGNSKGVIIPKQFLKELGSEKVEIKYKDGGIFISPLEDEPRKGWNEAFKNAVMDSNSEEDFFEGTENDFDREEWTW